MIVQKINLIQLANEEDTILILIFTKYFPNYTYENTPEIEYLQEIPGQSNKYLEAILFGMLGNGNGNSGEKMCYNVNRLQKYFSLYKQH